mgnify:CR=1 FL=1
MLKKKKRGLNMQKTKEWLVLNAVKAWLVNYEDKETELTPQYQQLHKELYNAFITEDTPVQKRRRPAKRARKKETSSSTSSEEKVTEPKEQT